MTSSYRSLSFNRWPLHCYLLRMVCHEMTKFFPSFAGYQSRSMLGLILIRTHTHTVANNKQTNNKLKIKSDNSQISHVTELQYWEKHTSFVLTYGLFFPKKLCWRQLSNRADLTISLSFTSLSLTEKRKQFIASTIQQWNCSSNTKNLHLHQK